MIQAIANQKKMKLTKKIKTLSSIIAFKFFNKKIPLSVRFNLNNRCNLRCEYCNVWNTKTEELTYEQIRKIIDDLKIFGSVHISYSGGEPMLRSDIGKIIDYTSKKGITSSINSNGFNIDKRVTELKNIDLVKLSLDGNEETHDKLRGKGSFKTLIKAAETLRENKIKFSFAMTLTKLNLDQIDFILETSRYYNTFCAFQPVKPLSRNKDISYLLPEKESLRETIKKLIRYKKKYPKSIRNSFRGLNHSLQWPNYKNNKCFAGEIFCMIMPDGSVLPCDRISYSSKIYNAKEIGFKKAFNNMPAIKCNGCCFCGALEMNYLAQLKFDILDEIMAIVR